MAVEKKLKAVPHIVVLNMKVVMQYCCRIFSGFPRYEEHFGILDLLSIKRAEQT